MDIAVDDPRAPDVSALLARHLAFTRAATPAPYTFALDVDQLAEPSVTFFSARQDGHVIGVAALKRLDKTHAELKSMHTAVARRRCGVGRALVQHILAYAASHGYERVSLETGTTDEFLAARTLYARAGFIACDAFGDYVPSVHNTFMTLRITPAATS